MKYTILTNLKINKDNGKTTQVLIINNSNYITKAYRTVLTGIESTNTSEILKALNELIEGNEFTKYTSLVLSAINDNGLIDDNVRKVALVNDIKQLKSNDYILIHKYCKGNEQYHLYTDNRVYVGSSSGGNIYEWDNYTLRENVARLFEISLSSIGQVIAIQDECKLVRDIDSKVCTLTYGRL